MSNMEYCRFQNTYIDLQECSEALANNELPSKEEVKFAKRLLKLCKEITDNYSESDIDSMLI